MGLVLVPRPGPLKVPLVGALEPEPPQAAQPTVLVLAVLEPEPPQAAQPTVFVLAAH